MRTWQYYRNLSKEYPDIKSECETAYRKSGEFGLAVLTADKYLEFYKPIEITLAKPVALINYENLGLEEKKEINRKYKESPAINIFLREDVQKYLDVYDSAMSESARNLAWLAKCKKLLIEKDEGMRAIKILDQMQKFKSFGMAHKKFRQSLATFLLQDGTLIVEEPDREKVKIWDILEDRKEVSRADWDD